jgi:anti-sigma-K factor RskA
VTPRNDPHARYEELAAGHALHALEPADEQDFVAHLDSCARCQADLAEHQATLVHLAYAPAAADPPPALLEGIRAGVLASGREASFPTPQPPADELARARDARRMRRAATWLGVAAAFALVVSLGVWNSALRSDRDQQDAWGERMREAVGRMSDATDTVPLHGEDGRLLAVAVVRGADLSLVVDGLPVNDEGTTYVLWGEDPDGDKHAVGAFDVESAFDVLDGMTMRDGIADTARLMVTREQGDAAPLTPTLPVLAVGEV